MHTSITASARLRPACHRKETRRSTHDTRSLGSDAVSSRRSQLLAVARWPEELGNEGSRHSSSTTAARSSITCTALIGVEPAVGAGSVQPGAKRPAAT